MDEPIYTILIFDGEYSKILPIFVSIVQQIFSHNEWSIHIGTLASSVGPATLATPLILFKHTLVPRKQLFAR